MSAGQSGTAFALRIWLARACGRVFGLAYQKHHTDGSAGYRVIIIKMKHHVVKPETGMLLLLFNDYNGEILTPLSLSFRSPNEVGKQKDEISQLTHDTHTQHSLFSLHHHLCFIRSIRWRLFGSHTLLALGNLESHQLAGEWQCKG